MAEAATTTAETPNTSEGSASGTTSSTATAADAGSQQQQSNGEKAASAETAAAGSEAAPAGAPEKYEFKAPEGLSFNPDVIDSYSKVAKELNLTQESAQKVVDVIGPAIAKSHADAMVNLRSEWTDAVKSDKELGGDKLEENRGIAKAALEKFGTPELATLLEKTGLGDNPEIIRAFFRAGKAISEDRSYVNGAKNNSTELSMAQRMYPNMNP